MVKMMSYAGSGSLSFLQATWLHSLSTAFNAMELTVIKFCPATRLPMSPRSLLPPAECRVLLAQYSPERLLVVTEAQEYGIAKASQPLFQQVGAGL